MKECIVIGAGPAGLAAALYLARYERESLLLTTDLGGQAFNAGEIENYPGYKKIAGSELIMKMVEQVKSYPKVELKYPVKIKKISKDNFFELESEEGEKYQAKSVIIASGKHHRMLGVEGEENYVGKGLSYCATCDGPFAKGKKSIVVGGGNSAASSALILSKIASEVTVLCLGEKMMAEQIRIDAMKSAGNIKIITQAKTTKLIDTGGMLSAIEYTDLKENKAIQLDAQMVFVEIGYVPNTDIFAGLVELNQGKEIKVNPDNSTKTEGLYACGDITEITHKQVVIAAGDGAKAAMAVNEYLEK
jgi:alkyl hydroperoxide reductase subunit F